MAELAVSDQGLKLNLDTVLDNYRDDFFKVEESRRDKVEHLKTDTFLETIIGHMCKKYDELKSKCRDLHGGYSVFLISWANFIHDLVIEKMEVISKNWPYDEQELFNIFHWLGMRVVDLNANENNPTTETTTSYVTKSSAAWQCKEPKQLKTTNRIRHIKTDRLYTINRLGGGCLGEIWRVGKRNMKEENRRGRKPLSEKQRNKALLLYKLSLILRNMDQYPEDMPPALIAINKGGMLLPNVKLIEYITQVSRVVVTEFRKWYSSTNPKITISKIMVTVKEDQSLADMFHHAIENIPDVSQKGFSKIELEEFRNEWQRKIAHAKVGDLIRNQVQQRNERRGKRGIGGQNLRCQLYNLGSKSKKTTSKINQMGKTKAKAITILNNKRQKNTTNKSNKRSTEVISSPETTHASTSKPNQKRKPKSKTNTKVTKKPPKDTTMPDSSPVTSNASTSKVSTRGRNIKKNLSKDFFYD